MKTERRAIFLTAFFVIGLYFLGAAIPLYRFYHDYKIPTMKVHKMISYRRDGQWIKPEKILAAGKGNCIEYSILLLSELDRDDAYYTLVYWPPDNHVVVHVDNMVLDATFGEVHGETDFFSKHPSINSFDWKWLKTQLK